MNLQIENIEVNESSLKTFDVEIRSGSDALAIEENDGQIKIDTAKIDEYYPSEFLSKFTGNDFRDVDGNPEPPIDYGYCAGRSGVCVLGCVWYSGMEHTTRCSDCCL